MNPANQDISDIEESVMKIILKEENLEKLYHNLVEKNDWEI